MTSSLSTIAMAAIDPAQAARADQVGIALAPGGGAIWGPPGASTGWAVAISSKVHYVAITDMSLLPAPAFGVFADKLSILPGFEVGPGGMETGAGEFRFERSAPIGNLVYASLYITYDLYRKSPAHDLAFRVFRDTVSTGTVVELPVSIEVTESFGAAPQHSAPKFPAALAFLTGGALWWRRRTERNRH